MPGQWIINGTVRVIWFTVQQHSLAASVQGGEEWSEGGRGTRWWATQERTSLAVWPRARWPHFAASSWRDTCIDLCIINNMDYSSILSLSLLQQRSLSVKYTGWRYHAGTNVAAWQTQNSHLHLGAAHLWLIRWLDHLHLTQTLATLRQLHQTHYSQGHPPIIMAKLYCLNIRKQHLQVPSNW